MQIASGLAHMNYKPAGHAAARHTGRLAMCNSHLACMQGCICQSTPWKSGTPGAFRLEQPQHSVWSSADGKHPQAFQACGSVPKIPADSLKAAQAGKSTAYILHVCPLFSHDWTHAVPHYNLTSLFHRCHMAGA